MSVIVEVRAGTATFINVVLTNAGTGGGEASLFASEMFTMYDKYATRHGWRFEEIEASASEYGGLREGSASISGKVWLYPGMMCPETALCLGCVWRTQARKRRASCAACASDGGRRACPHIHRHGRKLFG